MKHFVIRKVLLTFIAVTSISLLPNIASAKPSVSIHLPGFSIGFNDRHYNNRRNKNRNYRYYNDRYYYDNRTRGYRYKPSTRYRYRNRYNDYRRLRPRIYVPSYQSEICPEPGYSPYYYEDHGCRRHADHYHCD